MQIAIAGARIFGKAFLAAGRQAIQSAFPFPKYKHCSGARAYLHEQMTDAKYRPPGAGGTDVAGVGNATSGSLTDRLTREHRMTADEARLILNVKKDDPIERIVQVRAPCCPALTYFLPGVSAFARFVLLASVEL